jgi:hypothetical protein
MAALYGDNWSGQWAYWLGEFLGAVAAAGTSTLFQKYRLAALIPKKEQSRETYSQHTLQRSDSLYAPPQVNKTVNSTTTTSSQPSSGSLRKNNNNNTSDMASSLLPPSDTL